MEDNCSIQSDSNSELHDDEIDVTNIPVCDEALKPRVGLAFHSLEEGCAFYEAYATACGFTIRRSTVKRERDKSIVLRYVVCAREGKLFTEVDESAGLLIGCKRKRRRLSCRIGCMAKIVFRCVGAMGYVVLKFVEGHNHEMVSDGYRRLMKVNRTLDFSHQMFIAKCAKANISGAKCFRIFKEMSRGGEEVGCREIDFKNMSRDMKAFAEGIDAQLLLEKFARAKAKNRGFFFDYSVDKESYLTRLFWADPVAVQNYQIFGNAVSADSTYSTNRYSLIFMPFTRRDNHGKCVNFGAGLISREDADAYNWLLKTFVDCMGSPPKILITDQDLGLKSAIAKVLPHTRHRFCMWHIMTKLTEKLPPSLRENGDFFQKFDDMVWSDIDEASVFEAKWHDIMEEFDLFGQKWFDNIYELRTFWIPAYFRDVKISGLFRTTSPSESENSFFKHYLNSNANLSEVYMLFEIAIESQRDDHDALTLVDQTCSPHYVTKLQIERHAAAVYTNSIFVEVQNEIDLCVNYCTIPRTVEAKDQTVFEVDEDAVGVFKVTHNVSTDFLSCVCNLFVRKGMVCRHMVAVMRVLKYKTIPDKYIERRWTKSTCAVFDEVGQNKYASGASNQFASSQGVFGLACKCSAIAEGNEDITRVLTALLEEFYEKYVSRPECSFTSNGKQKVIEQYYGSSVPDQVTVHPPKVSKTKGSCSRKKSRREAAIERAKKPQRRCKKCNRMGHHHSRNCDKVSGQLD